jgi:ATP-dependent RNA helicase DeaD
MEILNNVQLEGRRINVEISKNDDGGGRRDHNGRVLVVVWWWKKFSPKREKETLLQEKVQVVDLDHRNSPREGGFGEVQLHVKVVLEEEVGSQEEGSSDRAPRRSESFGDSPRPRPRD